MRSIAHVYLAALLVCSVALAKPPKTASLRPVLDIQNQASLPRFTTDHQGHIVLSWIEKQGEAVQFYYAISPDQGRTFGTKVRVAAAPSDIAAHSEGMPKLAFKKNGTVMALFEVRKPTDEAPRASDLLYTESSDNGRTWSAIKAVHRDQTPGKGHSFADMTRLPSGEVGIVWLDEKMPGYEGRSVKFTQTLPGGGFGAEIIVDSNACQCCRTSLLASPDGRLHIAYRDMIPDNQSPQEPESRDMSYAVSADHGQTFSQPTVLHPDNWKINACPHSGIHLAATNQALWGTWYSGTTAQPGLRLTSINGKPQTTIFGSSAMKHPQVALMPDGSVLVVWDELVGEGMQAYRKIGLRQQRSDGQKLVGKATVQYLTPVGQMSTGPVIMPVGNRLLLAYEVEKGIKLVELPLDL